MKYSDEQRIEKILFYANQLMQFIKENNINRQNILDNYGVQWAINTPLYNIGELAYGISTEFKERNPQIPWHKIAGLRHRLVHDYAETNWEMVAGIVFDEIPVLIKQLQELVK